MSSELSGHIGNPSNDQPERSSTFRASAQSPFHSLPPNVGDHLSPHLKDLVQKHIEPPNHTVFGFFGSELSPHLQTLAAEYMEQPEISIGSLEAKGKYLEDELSRNKFKFQHPGIILDKVAELIDTQRLYWDALSKKTAPTEVARLPDKLRGTANEESLKFVEYSKDKLGYVAYCYDRATYYRKLDKQAFPDTKNSEVVDIWLFHAGKIIYLIQSESNI